MSLNFVAQPTNNTCVSACIAMILNIPVNVVIDEFHEGYFNKAKLSIHDYLESKGRVTYTHFKAHTFLNEFEWGWAYIATVPSLGTLGTFHAIVIDCTEPEKGLIINDPNRFPDKKHYVFCADKNGHYKEDEYPLISMILDYGIRVPKNGFEWDENFSKVISEG